MLILKQMLSHYHIRKCKLSGQIIRFNDWYYEDTEDGKAILYEAYHLRKKEQELKTFDYSKIQELHNTQEYKAALKDYEQQYLEATVLEKPIYERSVLEKLQNDKTSD